MTGSTVSRFTSFWPNYSHEKKALFWNTTKGKAYVPLQRFSEYLYYEEEKIEKKTGWLIALRLKDPETIIRITDVIKTTQSEKTLFAAGFRDEVIRMCSLGSDSWGGRVRNVAILVSSLFFVGIRPVVLVLAARVIGEGICRLTPFSNIKLTPSEAKGVS